MKEQKQRKQLLSKEERSARAKAGALKRWGAKKEIPPAPAETVATVTGVIVRSGGPGTIQPEPEAIIEQRPVAPSVPEKPAEEPRRQATLDDLGKIRRARKKVMPKAFGGALSYAEKRLAEAIRERAEAMNKLAMLNAEIPSLVQIITALGNSNLPPEMLQVGAIQMPAQPYPGSEGFPLQPTPGSPNFIPNPPLPQTMGAHGGAIGFEAPQQEAEDQFLKEDGGKWH